MMPWASHRGPGAKKNKLWGPHLLWASLACAAVLPSCDQPAHTVGQEQFTVEGTALTLPKVGDWVQDTTVPRPNPSAGGLMLRLVQKSAVPGSPRIEVRLEAPAPTPSVLNAYLTRNLRDMGALETAGQIRILHVDQQEIRVGRLPAWRVHHEFTTGVGASQASLYQASTFMVFEGRGITLSAAGRTELFHPLASSIAQVLDGASLDVSRIRGRKESSGAPASGSNTIDLGTVGGAKR